MRKIKAFDSLTLTRFKSICEFYLYMYIKIIQCLVKTFTLHFSQDAHHAHIIKTHSTCLVGCTQWLLHDILYSYILYMTGYVVMNINMVYIEYILLMFFLLLATFFLSKSDSLIRSCLTVLQFLMIFILCNF